MNLSALFINRPVATTLLTVGIVLAGLFAYANLPVAPLPQVDFPTIVVQANLPGASPDTVAATVASPLERHLGTIADVTEMTSTSTLGQCRIVLQFGLDRDINGAARDVQAAINAARADLPADLRSNPTWRKFNPASAPIMVLALTSATLTRGQIYDAADTVVQQRLSQVPGIGQITLGGSALPAVRVDLNPNQLAKYGIGLEDVRAALAAANANSPKGAIEFSGNRYQLYSNDQASNPADYTPLIIAWRNNAPVRLSDIATVTEGVENVRTEGLANGHPAVLVILYPQPGANIIQTVDAVNALLPVLRASIPSSINVAVALDRSTTIRGSLADTQVTLLIAVFLVISVVFLFLRDPRAALIPSVALPVSIMGTFAGMYLLGFSLDNLSLMALTISTGFVVDDAIVVLENISRHLDAGLSPREAALRGAREVGFTVLSMSLSLIAVFLPILLMGGIVGRLFREFGLTLSLAIVFSLIVSLTTTPMMCAIVLRPRGAKETGGALGRLFNASRATFDFAHDRYTRSLTTALRHPLLSILALGATLGLTIFLFIAIPKGLFPVEDTGVLIGGIQADQSISFQSMEQKLAQFMAIVRGNQAVENVTGFTGGSSTNSAFVFVTLKPLSARHASATQVIAELRRPLGRVAGARLFLQPAADLRAGGRQSNAAYQFTLQGTSAPEVYDWARKLEAALAHSPVLRDVNSDQQQGGLETNVVIERATAARLGVTPNQIDNTLDDAFGQRLVSTIYREMNQYHVVMEVAPRYWQSPTILKDIYVSTSGAPAAGTSFNRLRRRHRRQHFRKPLRRRHRRRFGTQRGAQRHRRLGQVQRLERHRRQHHRGDDGAALRLRPFRARHHPALRQPPGLLRRLDDLLQPRPGKIAERRRRRHPPDDARDRHARRHPRLLRRHRPALRPVPFPGAAADPRRPARGLHRARHPLRKHHPPDHHPLHAALGRRRRPPRPHALPPAVHRHLADRPHPAHRHRQEERHHDDRLRDPRRTQPQPHAAPRHPRGGGHALPSDHDDDHGRHLRRGAARAEPGLRRRASPAARHLHHRRPDREPGADALHHARHLPLSRPLPSLAQPPRRPPACHRTGRHGAGGMRARALAALLLLAGCPLAACPLVGCTVGPNYHRPAAIVPTHYKELSGWVLAQPEAAINRGAWWAIFNDPTLDALEAQVVVSNQTIRADAFAYAQARALVNEARAGLYPTLAANTGVTRASSTSGFSSTPVATTNYTLEGSGAWDLDLWGAIRRQVESEVAAAQVSAADLAAAELSEQSAAGLGLFPDPLRRRRRNLA